MFSIFNKPVQPFDFIKPNAMQKLAYKVKHISQISRGLIMLFRKFENNIFLD